MDEWEFKIEEYRWTGALARSRRTTQSPEVGQRGHSVDGAQPGHVCGDLLPVPTSRPFCCTGLEANSGSWHQGGGEKDSHHGEGHQGGREGQQEVKRVLPQLFSFLSSPHSIGDFCVSTE